MEVQEVSKESASPSDGQPSSQGKGNEPVPKEADLQDPGNKDESVMKEVAKLNTKNRVQMKALSEARDQCYVADKLCAQEVHLSLLRSFVSECSFWVLPHLEALGTRFCLWGLQTVPHGGSQEAPRALWKVQGGISHKSGS